MQIINRNVQKFQQGGAVPAQAPEQAAQPSPEEMMQAIVAGAQEAVQTGNAELALQVCQAIVEMAGSSAPQEAPVYQKCGGRMVKKSKKSRK